MRDTAMQLADEQRLLKRLSEMNSSYDRPRTIILSLAATRPSWSRLPAADAG